MQNHTRQPMQAKKKGPAKRASTEQIRARIQDLMRRGEPQKRIMALTGATAGQLRSTKIECECGQPVRRGGVACERCEHIETHLYEYGRSVVGYSNYQKLARMRDYSAWHPQP